MNLVDSSGWLSYVADDENASFFASAVEDTERLVVPTICVYEVFKRVLRDRGQDVAMTIVAAMLQTKVVELDASLALAAAELSVEYKLPMADSIILATARVFDATVWTQDTDFAAIAGVEYIPHPSMAASDSDQNVDSESPTMPPTG
jgi:predicted nucleic acid-binding protein